MLRLGIIGCGRVTSMFHVKAIRELDQFKVTAVADNNKGRMEKVRKKLDAENGYLDYRELLSDGEVEAVAVNTPPRFHEKMVLDSIKAGKHVQCEKPLAQNIPGCQHIDEAANLFERVVMPVHNYAFTPCVESAREMILDGEIGEVNEISLEFKNNLRSYRSETSFRLEQSYGIIEDVLPHIYSVAQSIDGPITGVENIRGWKEKFSVIDNLSFSLKNIKEADIECIMNWTSMVPAFNVSITGDRGRIEMELMKKPFRVSLDSNEGKKQSDKKGFGKYLDLIRLKHPSFERQYHHFYSVVKNLEEPRFTIEDEINMLTVMDKVKRTLSEPDMSKV